MPLCVACKCARLLLGPIFLPDPRDGSLYTFGSRKNKKDLTKLPFTVSWTDGLIYWLIDQLTRNVKATYQKVFCQVPQLVQASPCKSSDGFLYAGKKTDSWLVVDPLTGKIQQKLSSEKIESVCPSKKRYGRRSTG